MATVTEAPPNAETTTTTKSCCGGKSIFKYLFLGLVAVVAILAAVIAMQPEDFKVARSMTIAAEPAAVFAQVNDFHNWEAWSPWAKLDPNAKGTYEGPTSGEGAIYRWDGNSDVGAGSMTIVESKPNELVRLRLDFIRPFEGTSDVEFKLVPTGENTNVAWSMSGKNNFMAKAISLVIDCEKMVGDSYEEGLANIKAIVEPGSKP